MHKLILAQKRDAHEGAESRKDLAQAAALIEALREAAPFALEDALDEARAMGRDGWARPIERSMAQIAALA